jgi:hypothetical protein
VKRSGRSAGGFPGGWEALRRWIIRERAKERCECEGECGTDHEGRCRFYSSLTRYRDARYRWRWLTALEVAHVDHDTQHNTTWNLRAMCPTCHHDYDVLTHPRYAKAKRKANTEKDGQ